ncbi:MAG: FMN-binding protein [Candidatus Thermoplasmatota archaeon]|jgi:electron transport complex protein RnfG|nr:FMN-binding protein [Candidatus Thermoplasmatota archaeon]
MSEGGGVKQIIPILFLTIVVCISVVLLVLTDSITRDLIEENERKEIKKALEEIFPKMEDYEHDKKMDIYIIKGKNDTDMGLAFKAIGKGYGDKINIMVGLNSTPAEIKVMSWKEINSTVEIIKIKILEPISETPGLGAKILEDGFQREFQGSMLKDVKLNGEGETDGIDGITGATISSKAVVNGIKTTAFEKIKLIKKGGEV